MKIPAAWIKKNMFSTYSEELGRSLTEAEVRFNRCLEQLSVPSWYRTYSKPPKILKNNMPIDNRPATWKTMEVKSCKSPIKTQKKKSPKTTPKKSRPDSGFNETYRISRKTLKNGKNVSISITSSSESEIDSPTTTDKSFVYTSKFSSPPRSRSDTYTISPSSSDIECDSPVKGKKSIQSSSLHKTPQKSIDVSLITSSPCDKKCMSPAVEELNNMDLSRISYTPRNPSNTFPRRTPSRKVENINIVLPKPFPLNESTLLQSSSKDETFSNSNVIYKKTRNIDVSHNNDNTITDLNDSKASKKSNKNHASFMVADVAPRGVKPQVQGYAGLDSGDELSKRPPKSAPSPNTRFFTSRKKSTALEQIVQTNRKDGGTRIVQEIIGELERSFAEGRNQSGCAPQSEECHSFVKSMVSALENNDSSEEEEDDRQSNHSTDSELAKSTSISFKSYDDSTDEPSKSFPTSCDESEASEESEQTETSEKSAETTIEEKKVEEEIYWIPNKIRDLPRTSSRLSVLSRGSGLSGFGYTSGRNSPGLSPIKKERREDWFHQQTKGWGLTYSARRDRASKQLFRIDETRMADSGYSDERSSTLASSKAAWTLSRPTTRCSYSGTRRSSPSTSISTSPTLVEDDEEEEEEEIMSSTLMSQSGPYVLKSFLV